MPVTSDFKTAVQDKNVRRVRIMMKDSLIRDPSFTEFDEMSREAEKGLGTRTLYERHDGENFSMNKSDWNKTYMNNQMVDLMSNFSRERLNHMKEVCSFIYADEIRDMQQHRTSSSYQEVRHEKNRNSSAMFNLIMLCLAVVIVLLIIKWLL